MRPLPSRNGWICSKRWWATASASIGPLGLSERVRRLDPVVHRGRDVGPGRRRHPTGERFDVVLAEAPGRSAFGGVRDAARRPRPARGPSRAPWLTSVERDSRVPSSTRRARAPGRRPTGPRRRSPGPPCTRSAPCRRRPDPRGAGVSTCLSTSVLPSSAVEWCASWSQIVGPDAFGLDRRGEPAHAFVQLRERLVEPAVDLLSAGAPRHCALLEVVRQDLYEPYRTTTAVARQSPANRTVRLPSTVLPTGVLTTHRPWAPCCSWRFRDRSVGLAQLRVQTVDVERGPVSRDGLRRADHPPVSACCRVDSGGDDQLPRPRRSLTHRAHPSRPFAADSRQRRYVDSIRSLRNRT